jgi:hypothetical protein
LGHRPRAVLREKVRDETGNKRRKDIYVFTIFLSLSLMLTTTPSVRRIPPRERIQLAYDLTYEGGDLVPPFQKDYLENFIKNQKAKVCRNPAQSSI